MDPRWLLNESLGLRLLVIAGIVLPALFILLSRRAGVIGKLWWASLTQLPWAFLWFYGWLWEQRYGGTAGAPATAEALGWWVLAFPWGVYLLFRATRRRFPGERPRHHT